MKVNNTVYETYGLDWWKEEAGFEFTSLRYSVNPVRYSYFRRSLGELRISGKRVLDIGCGGGYLSEEFAKDGFDVSGIDPAEASIAAAQAHAVAQGLEIYYQAARGEALPFEDASFDIVACCDVLEHVDRPAAVILEAARVLKRGGVFFFDTVNRTFRSRLLLIHIWQDLHLIGFDEKNVHVWEKFLRPHELASHLRSAELVIDAMKGISPGRHPMALLFSLLRLRAGRLDSKEASLRFVLRESDDLSVSYMGRALKP